MVELNITALYKKKAFFWEKQRWARSLELFHKAVTSVPAYRNFLGRRGIKSAVVRSEKEWATLPITSKKEYLRRYPLNELLWGGHMKRPLTWTATSGSTGEPFYFPRGYEIDWQTSLVNEMFLKNSSSGIVPTLVIDCFGMGVWIGGLITYQGFNIASSRGGYPVSIITPGINKTEIFKALRSVAPHFKQVIIAGYPPFVKDLVDEAPREGINFKKLKPRFILAAEMFTEKFRDYIAAKSGIKNICRDTLNIYGTADIGTMAFETPVAILLRRLALKNKNLFDQLFTGAEKMPTLAQFNPLFINFEAVDGELLVTGDSAIPLIRYALGDRGGIITFSKMRRIFRRSGIDIMTEAKKADITDLIMELPFVYVYERNDFSTSLYGITIYPNMIRDSLIAKPLSDWLTGKFTLATAFGAKQDQYLETHLELRPGIKAHTDLADKAHKHIAVALQEHSSEFRELSSQLKNRPLIKVKLWPAEHPKFFKSGIKQKWVKK